MDFALTATPLPSLQANAIADTYPQPPISINEPRMPICNRSQIPKIGTRHYAQRDPRPLLRLSSGLLSSGKSFEAPGPCRSNSVDSVQNETLSHSPAHFDAAVTQTGGKRASKPLFPLMIPCREWQFSIPWCEGSDGSQA